ncbi:hypothetical protein F5B22DRAFT_421947 [Xylaria bambusicola]|uniref:uncharacterized protein n=1 Tax=Xylaria bambusicola TaxID=326684 RepID=UPI00200895DC|nr:uncharacterized protein F5B22DRAFT_421947 [Xylaria bambusicola]KAI0523879.1 hypothetical protein F5B22DRAFT_421947 [Xylaria bambusicola]
MTYLLPTSSSSFTLEAVSPTSASKACLLQDQSSRYHSVIFCFELVINVKMMLYELDPNLDLGVSKLGDIHADIVLVHGLMGDYVDTWKAEDDTVWPRDLLPQALHKQAGLRIRVLSFEYGGSIMGTSSRAGIDDTAHNLLQYLYDKREDQRDKSRPIIFVGHSLGGVIIKRAIRIAYNDYRFRSIKKSILGVIFFATMHRGTRQEYAVFLQDVLKCHSQIKRDRWPVVVRSPSKGMYEEIKKTPEVFEPFSKDFIPLFHKLSLETFQELHIKKPLLDALVVNKTLGSLTAERPACIEISGDHLSLCKFEKDQPQGTMFHIVEKRIREMITNSPWQKENRLKAIDLLCSDTLCQSMMINKLANGTGQWVFNRPQYQMWLDMKLTKPRLWITGEPGCGKSYLAKNVVDKLREKDEPVICAFLREPGPTVDLWHLMSEILQQALEIEPMLPRQPPSSQKVGSIRSLLINARNQVLAAGSQRNEESHPTENNLHGLLASTIRQVLVEITPESIDTYLLPILRSENPSHSLKLNRLQELWPKIMAKALSKCPVLTVVIDGFDKMERQDQKTFLDILTKFGIEWPIRGRFRLLFLSNDYSAIHSDLKEYKFIRYLIDKAEDTGPEIKASVTQRIDLLSRIHRYTPKMRKAIEEGVPKASSGGCDAWEFEAHEIRRKHLEGTIRNSTTEKYATEHCGSL